MEKDTQVRRHNTAFFVGKTGTIMMGDSNVLGIQNGAPEKENQTKGK